MALLEMYEEMNALRFGSQRIKGLNIHKSVEPRHYSSTHIN